MPVRLKIDDPSSLFATDERKKVSVRTTKKKERNRAIRVGPNGEPGFGLFGIFGTFEEIGERYHLIWSKCDETDPEDWEPDDEQNFKELFGSLYGHIDASKFGRFAVKWRKLPTGKGGWKDWCKVHGIERPKAKSGPDEFEFDPASISPELAEHYQSEDFRIKKAIIFHIQKGRCKDCDDPIQSNHHRNYDSIRKPEEIDDLVGLCRRCHYFADRNRRKAAKERRETKRERKRLQQGLEQAVLRAEAEVDRLCQ